MNPYDKNAIEVALSLREYYGGQAIILSMGPEENKKSIIGGISMGADSGILLSSKSFAGSDTLATSYILSQAIKKIGGVDLVLFGKQTIDSDTGQVGPITAEFLGLPQITNVIDIEAKHKALVVSRAFDSSISLLEVYLPAVITVTDAINIPCIPNIYSISFASKSEIIVWNESDIEADTDRIGIVGSPTVVRRILEPKKKKKEKKKKKNKIAFEVANKINAQVGVTRPLTELDIFSIENQIRQSGHTVKPNVIINLGIQGASQYTTGMDKADLIISVNSDRNALIFDISDYTYVGDVKEFLTELNLQI